MTRPQRIRAAADAAADRTTVPARFLQRATLRSARRLIISILRSEAEVQRRRGGGRGAPRPERWRPLGSLRPTDSELAAEAEERPVPLRPQGEPSERSPSAGRRAGAPTSAR